MSIEQTLDNAVQSITQALQVVGPKATKLALQSGQVLALRDLISAGTWAGLCSLMFVAALYGLWRFWRADWEELYRKDLEVINGFAVMVLCAVAFVAFSVMLANLSYLIDPVLWVGLSRPEVYLAVKALKL